MNYGDKSMAGRFGISGEFSSGNGRIDFGGYLICAGVARDWTLFNGMLVDEIGSSVITGGLIIPHNFKGARLNFEKVYFSGPKELVGSTIEYHLEGQQNEGGFLGKYRCQPGEGNAICSVRFERTVDSQPNLGSCANIRLLMEKFFTER